MLEKLMKFKASKKTSLLLSLFCILMCVTVLIGTSFAWFTDTVTSGSNRIQTGTLKVGMEYRTVTLGQASQSWTDANGAGDILDPDALYEPGYVSLTLFRIENKGSLSFKYQLALKLAEQQGINVFGEPFKLSDYLSFNLIPLAGTDKEKALGETATYQREDALALLNNNPAELGFNAQNTVDAVMPVKENGNANDKYDVVALVIYMPETVGNKAMYDTTAPSVSLDFKLVATQYTDEKDSFDQYYDEKAVYNDEDNPVRPNWTAFQYIKGDLANELVCYDGTGFPVVKVKSDAPLNGTLIVSECNAPIGFNVTAGTIYKSYNISVVGDNGNPVAGDFTVQMYVGEGYPNLKMYHNGVEMAAGDYSYNADDGYVTFTTDSFSVFTAGVAGISAKINDTWYPTLGKAFDSVHQGSEKTATIKLFAREQILDAPVVVNAGEDIALDLNGCTVKTVINMPIQNNGTLTIKDTSEQQGGVVSGDGEIILDSDDNGVATFINSTGALNVESGKIIGSANYSEKAKSIHLVNLSSGSVFTFSGGEIVGKRDSIVEADSGGIYGVYSKDSTVNMSAGIIKITSTKIGPATGICGINSVVNITGGDIDVNTHNGIASGVSVSDGDKNCTVSNCTINLGATGTSDKVNAVGVSASGSFTGNLNLTGVSIASESTGSSRGINFLGSGSFAMSDDASDSSDRNIVKVHSKLGGVGIYVKSDSQNIELQNFDVDVVSDSGTIYGIQNSGSNVVVSGSESNKNTITMHGNTIPVYGISSQAENGKVSVSNTKVAVYGNSIIAVNATESGEVTVSDCDFVTSAPTRNPYVFSSKKNAKIIVNGGNTIDSTNTLGGDVVVITTANGGTVTFNSGTAPATAQGGHLTWSN